MFFLSRLTSNLNGEEIENLLKELVSSKAFLVQVEEKWDKRLKGREVACGDQQKKCLTKEEVHSPTVTTTAVFLTTTIEAEEERVETLQIVVQVSTRKTCRCISFSPSSLCL